MTPREAQVARIDAMAIGVPMGRIDARPLPYWRNVHEAPSNTKSYSRYTPHITDEHLGEFWAKLIKQAQR